VVDLPSVSEVSEIVLLSLFVSGTATVIAGLAGVPLGAALALGRFPGRRLVLRVVYTLMGLPPVLAGVVVFLALSSRGPLGGLGLLFTPAAMVIAQTLLVLPIVAGLTSVAVGSKDREIRETALALGATPVQAAAKVVAEARLGITGALTAGLGRALGEVGAVMLVGGNIASHTRVMTTAIVLETRKGNYALGVWLGLILLAVAYAANTVVDSLREGGERA
jgi:tungstate transport system permease protein